jgi:ferritin-like metal-binding protein YciE
VTTSLSDQLVKYLADAHSIEEQALAQLRSAPNIAGSDQLSKLLAAHLVETEQHEQSVKERMSELGASPSRVKDVVMAVGGKGFVLFARLQPDTPGKLATHAYSYERLEEASYAMLRHVAERIGDTTTAELAGHIGRQELEMAERLRGSFDASIAASVEGVGRSDLEDRITSYLADAHALERQAEALLSRAVDMVEDTTLAGAVARHLDETRDHAVRLERRLDALDDSPSRIKDAAMKMGGTSWSGFFGMHPDTPGKLVAFMYAFEHLEIGGYIHLRGVAERAGDMDTVELAEQICRQEETTADFLRGQFDRAADLSLDAQGVTSSG